MAENKRSFIVYVNWNEAVKELNDKQAGKLFKWLLDYCNDKWKDKEIVYPDDVAVKILCKTYQPILKRDLKKYEDRVSRIMKNGKQYQNNIVENKTEIKTDIDTKVETDVGGVICNMLDVNCNMLNSNNNIVSKDTPNKNANASWVCDTKIVFEREMLFEKFWKAYPRKEGKQKCANWFMNKSRKIDDALVNQMLFAIEKWKHTEQWLKQNGQFIPQPYNWLNRGGWEDELPVSRQQQEQETINNFLNSDFKGGFFN